VLSHRHKGLPVAARQRRPSAQKIKKRLDGHIVDTGRQTLGGDTASLG
jgi:hypothetical protein